MTLALTGKETDAHLVARMQAGELAAFETIVERYRAVLIACAHARLGSFADAEDVAQEAFVQAYFHLGELREPAALLPWLRRTADRIALMRLRSRREQPADPEDFDALVDTRAGTETVEVESLLSQLPGVMRETVSLTVLAGYTCAEAARILGVREGTVKSRLNRARAKLKEVLGMAEHDLAGPTGDFTQKTIERLKREARRLAAEGKFFEASEKARQILDEQVKPLYGDPKQLGMARTVLAAFESEAFQPDEDAVALSGLGRREQRRRECEANAAQYGFTLDELDWEVADVNIICETLGRPTGRGKDIWGVPVSRLPLAIIDLRELCRRLKVSPLAVFGWVGNGCPILRCWPFARFDLDRVQAWLAEHGIKDWPKESAYALERPIRILYREVYDGRLLPEGAEEVMDRLGFGVWGVPTHITGGW
ncbi:MAG: RNA polymerase sigma factor [Armatimonadota bacterium]